VRRAAELRGRSRLVAVLATLAATTAAGAGDLAAQAGEAPDSVVRLPPIVTMVTREPRSAAETGLPIAVADSARIRRDRTVGLHEVLRGMPGVQVASRYGTDDVNIGIRGSAARARQAVRGVAVLLDGIPLTEPDGAARVDLVELAAVRQVEVLRGPASALHAGSSGGVVNLVSRTGRDSPGLAAHARAGAFGFEKYDARAGGEFAGGRGSALAAASRTSTDGYREHADASIERGHLMIDRLLGGDARWSLEASGSRLDSRLPGSLTWEELEAEPGAAAPAATAFGFGRADTRWRAGSRLEAPVGRGSASGHLFYGGRTLDFPIPSQIVDLNLHRIQAGARFRAPPISGLPLGAAVGLDYDRVGGTDQRWENAGGAHGALHDDGRFSVPGVGLYTELDWRLSPRTSAMLGFRYDRVTYHFQSATPGAIPRQSARFDQASPRLALVSRPGPATTLSASVGRGFEVPAIGELSPSPGDPLGPIRPKSLWNVELDARHTVADRLRLDGAVFVAAVRGEFVPVTIDGTSLPENASRSRNAGLELGLTFLAAPEVDVGAGYTLLDLRLQDYETRVLDATGDHRTVDYSGKRLPAVPAHRFTGELRVRPRAGLELGTTVEWQSVVYVETSNAKHGTLYVADPAGGPPRAVPFRAVPARALVHLDASLRLGPTTLFGRLENLFGSTHAGNVLANDNNGRFYEPGSPASVSLGLGVATAREGEGP